MKIARMQDYAKPDRQVLLDGLAHDPKVVSSNELKRMRALAWLGPKWVLHQSNAVKRRTKA